ncbi:MAG: protein kinase [Methylococcales bacterium]
MTMAVRSLKVITGSYSIKGLKENNEDSLGALIPLEPGLTNKGITIAIADGMSGCGDGKQASQCCVSGFLNDYYSTPDSWTVKTSGQKVLSATNTWLYSQGIARFSTNKGLVSTLSTLVLKSTTAHFFHIGDSRIYRLRKGNLEQMTRDHRIWVSEESSYLNRAMGIEPRLEVDYKAFPIQVDDLFLLTTDGVHDFINDQVIRKVLNTELSLDEIAQTLVKSASAEGSDDNLTCQLVKVTQLPLAHEDEIIRRYANLPFPPDLNPGMILDGYKIEEEIHASKRTQIYRAFDTKTKKQVILKTPSINYEDNLHYIDHFLHEEWAGKRINHKNVLKILDSDRPKTCIYYVTEYIDGLTLRDWMKENEKHYIREIREIVKQIATGLGAFHRKEMIHQDLKPENIMMTRDGTVKIIDFGSVKIAGISDFFTLEQWDSEEDNVLGTLNYSAPEYHLGQRGTVKSDLYSLAVITYEMINGVLPFGRDMPEKPNKINLAKMQYVPSMHVNPMVPIWIDCALKKGCSINVQTRHENIADFMHDITTPNAQFLQSGEFTPLIERNPVVFWRTVSVILAVANGVLLYFFLLNAP